VSCYRLIDAEKTNYSVTMLCKVLKISRSGYYAWRDWSPPASTDTLTLRDPGFFHSILLEADGTFVAKR